MKKYQEFIKMLKFSPEGLIPAIVQDCKDNTVLMVAYMNKESLLKTLSTKKTWFYSRSRKKLWMKGEESGNIQKVKEIYVDCDADCILVKVQQVGNASCHTGYRSCFYRKYLPGGKLRIVGEKIFIPEKVYKKTK